MSTLLSSRWFTGDDEVAVLHRVAARNAGIDPAPDGERPVIGIANSASDLNPCNLPLNALAAQVAAGVRAAGGVAMEFPVMSLGEDLMKPSAMLYRNLVAMEVEEYLRSYPLDGVVLRISGTAFGTCIVHVAPEAGVGGPLALVRDGDPIALDVEAGTLDLAIAAEALAERRAAWQPPAREHVRGWPALYQAHVTQADEGCDFDFLQAPTPGARRMVEPVIGRS